MKILQVIPHFSFDYGGPDRVVFDISKNLSDRGHEVVIYTTDVEEKKRNTDNRIVFKDENIDLHYFNTLNNWVAHNLKLHISSNMKKAIKKNINNFDIIHLHGFRSIPNFYVSKQSHKFNVPYVIQAHGASSKIIGKQSIFRTLSKEIFDLFITKKILDNACQYIALNELERKQYIMNNIEEQKVTTLPNGVYFEDFDNYKEHNYLNEKFNIGDDYKIILYLGRIHINKGLGLLVDSFEKLSHEFNKIILLIVGPDDGYLENLKKIINSKKLENQIIFTGPLYGDNKLEVLKRADVFVLPSRYETFPVTVLEAGASGTPVVLSQKCGISDIVDKKFGFSVDLDEEIITESINRILRDKKLMKYFQRNGKKIVKKNYSWRKVTKNLIDIYDSCL